MASRLQSRVFDDNQVTRAGGRADVHKVEDEKMEEDETLKSNSSPERRSTSMKRKR